MKGRRCHWCDALLVHNGMFCRSECSRSFWKAQADASPRRTEHSRRMAAVMARKKQAST